MPFIPLVDLKAQYAAIRPEVRAAVDDVLDSAHFIQGRAVAEFERKFAAFCGAGFAVGVGSGTDALTLALRAVGVGAGHEVVTAANTFAATAEAVVAAGARPVFVDVDARHFNMTAEGLDAAITPRTRAAVPVHLYGQPAPMAEIMDVARRRSIKVVEDAAQAHGSECGGKRVGSWGDAAAFSFYPAKNLGAFGDAGAVVTGDEEIAGAVRMLRDHGRTGKYRHERVGVNSRLDTLQAAVLDVKLGHLEEWNRARRAVAAAYDAALDAAPGLTLPVETPGARHVYHLYVVRTRRRDELRRHAAENGVGVGIHYPVPLHLQPAFRHLGYGPGRFPVAERLAGSILSIPLYPEMQDAQVAQVVRTLTAFGSAEECGTRLESAGRPATRSNPG